MAINVTVRGLSGSGSGGGGTVPLPRHGISCGFDIITRTDAAIAFELDQIVAVGAKVIRVDLLNQASYQTGFGKVLAGAEARGLKVSVVLRGTSNPTTVAALQTYTTDMVNTWGGHTAIVSWEANNEPNLGSGIGLSRYTPAQYATELITVYNAVKAILPGAFVVNGGLGVWAGSGTSYPKNWWPGVLAAGARGHFDALNQHFYGFPTNIQWTDGLAMDSDGKPIIVTESGESTNNVSEATQANIVTAALNDVRVPSLMIYAMMNLAGFGLLRDDLTQKPSWAAYAAAA